jgi:ribosomal protein S18 acetylase RimI-like enzyme
MNNDIKIISTKSEIRQVVDVHKESFSGFFMTELGDQFLALYYLSVAQQKDGIVLGFFEDNKLHGFCVATTLSKGFSVKIIKQNFIKFGYISLYLLIFKTKALIRLINNLTKHNPNINDDSNYAELLSIATAKDVQGKGIGQLLLTTLEKELQKRNCKKITLTTDFFDNEKTIGFYKKIGYTVMYEFTAYPNRKMYRMYKEII